jgi:hypothetical protein
MRNRGGSPSKFGPVQSLTLEQISKKCSWTGLRRNLRKGHFCRTKVPTLAADIQRTGLNQWPT